LYQFIPEDDQVVARMIRSARMMVIISEPVVNMTTSARSLLSRIALRATAVEGRRFPRRHTIESLAQTLDRVAPSHELIERQEREAVYVVRTGANLKSTL
jgi:hypothetical protein